MKISVGAVESVWTPMSSFTLARQDLVVGKSTAFLLQSRISAPLHSLESLSPHAQGQQQTSKAQEQFIYGFSKSQSNHFSSAHSVKRSREPFKFVSRSNRIGQHIEAYLPTPLLSSTVAVLTVFYF